MNEKWSKFEEDYIRENYKVLKDREIAENLSEQSGRKITKYAVTKKRQLLKLKKPRGAPLKSTIRHNDQIK
jgi:hypothetical protein